MTQTQVEDLEIRRVKIADNIEGWLIQIYNRGRVTDEDIERILEVKRIQTLNNGRWETVGYRFMLSYGGPTVYIDTVDKEIVVWWGGEHRRHIGGYAKYGLLELESYFDQIQ